MEIKGYIVVWCVGCNKIYWFKVCLGKVIGEVIDDLINWFFDGEVLLLMRYLINDWGIMDDDFFELCCFIDFVEVEKWKDEVDEWCWNFVLDIVLVGDVCDFVCWFCFVLMGMLFFLFDFFVLDVGIC